MRMPPFFSRFSWKNTLSLLGKVEFFSYPARQNLPRPANYAQPFFPFDVLGREDFPGGGKIDV